MLTLRTDPEPLTRRLHLPAQIRAVRWVSVSPVRDTGGVPGPADFYDVYAYVELDADAWTSLEKSAGGLNARGVVTVPASVAAVLIPAEAIADFTPSDAAVRAEGPSFNPATLAAEPNTEVDTAVRIGGALVIQMRVH